MDVFLDLMDFIYNSNFRSMDKKTVLLASACTLLMMSCSNDAELIKVAETTGLQTKAFVGEADFQI
mgnify:CR=1 FL=1